MAMDHEREESWCHDDKNLRSYKVGTFSTKEEKKLSENKRSKEGISYLLEGVSLISIGKPKIQNGLPILQNCQTVKLYKRPDHTILEQSETRAYPLCLYHSRFYHDNATQVAYQMIILQVKHEGSFYPIGEEFRVERPYPYQREFLGWEDDEENHVSKKIEKIFINLKEAIDQEHIKSEEAIIYLGKRCDNEEVQHHEQGLFQWRIPHSGRWYGYINQKL